MISDDELVNVVVFTDVSVSFQGLSRCSLILFFFPTFSQRNARWKTRRLPVEAPSFILKAQGQVQKKKNEITHALPRFSFKSPRKIWRTNPVLRTVRWFFNILSNTYLLYVHENKTDIGIKDSSVPITARLTSRYERESEILWNERWNRISMIGLHRTRDIQHHSMSKRTKPVLEDWSIQKLTEELDRTFWVRKIDRITRNKNSTLLSWAISVLCIYTNYSNSNNNVKKIQRRFRCISRNDPVGRNWQGRRRRCVVATWCE